jgi:hypothetical protein
LCCLFKTNPKFSQIQPSLTKPKQRKSKKKAWISLDFLRRFGLFQWVTATPQGKRLFPAPYLPFASRALATLHSPTGDKVPCFLVLAKEILKFDQEIGFS